MLNKIILFILPLFLLLSCTDESTISNESKKSNQTTQGVIIDSEFPYVIQNNQIISNGMIEKTGRMKTIGVMDGPYYIKASLNKAYSNKEILITSSQIPGIPTGYYFCDIYYCSASVLLPDNYLKVAVNSPTISGFTDVSKFSRGVNWIMSTTGAGTSLVMSTYTIYINYNVLGQSIGKEYPLDRNTLNFSYSIMTY